ncbi:MAG TPA: sugar ABC transporter ATP-binding protein [Geminicoccus sp.]|jgi:ribose transport system ATP-binding protein|uniref:sugar ABC transporter ATP-binding protein n=1 Tax=Geminicoccus sp. TaxID=2024832 RepID=UPI002E32CA33|nr:sugar ABC transporter ATP-binding protein [Geminicoccus sp.]HEX2528926.1 sugar ABC transporter ATP-binding protein [Geminicoccus sp.]
MTQTVFSQAPVSDSTPFLSLSGVSKRYGGVRALENVDFACRQGSIHAVLGENGAGKSTLIKIIAGVVQPDEGVMRLEGNEVQFRTPLAANAAGIVCIFQELSLMPDLSVADNIGISNPPRTRLGLIDKRAQRRRAEELLAKVGCEDVNPMERVGNLPLSRRQMVEIAKALGRNPKLLILDEATSALTSSDVTKVYAILKKLREKGLCLLYISHRMHEIRELADTCSVFRNGRHVETFAAGTRTSDDIVQLMIGREMAHVYPDKPAPSVHRRPPVLEVRDLRWTDRLNGISLSVGKGEIVGLGGLDGQGQRELQLALFGVLRGVSGEILIDGKPTSLGSPAQAKKKAVGMALIPEDRKTEGLMLPMSVADNLGMAAMSSLTSGIFVDRGKERAAIQRMVEKLKIKVGDVGNPVATLSGGNQQKVVIAKWLMTDPRIILLNDPTRGIDVGTKQELYQLLRDLADAGASILFYTTDYDELIGCCDRVLILYDGQIVRELTGDGITETAIVAASLNLDPAEAKAVTGEGGHP